MSAILAAGLAVAGVAAGVAFPHTIGAIGQVASSPLWQIIAPVGGVIVALLVARRQRSGRITTTEAETLWTESTTLRAELRSELEALRARLRAVEAEAAEMRAEAAEMRRLHAECERKLAELGK